jgi:hypothetical protein
MRARPETDPLALMRLPWPVSTVLVAAAVAGGVPASEGAADGQRQFTLVEYAARIDVAGFLTIRAFEDTTRECEPGRDVALEYTTDFELGAPQKTKIKVAYGMAFSIPVQKRGGAVHEGKVVNYTETNTCPPKLPVSPGKPECSTLRGTLGVALSPTPFTRAEEDLTPLVRDMSITVDRRDGGNQQGECMLSSARNLKAKVGNAEIGPLWTAPAGLVVPLGVTSEAFRRLPKGKAIRRLIRLNGACNGVVVSTGQAEGRAAPRAIPRRDCTVTGKIFVSVRRAG